MCDIIALKFHTTVTFVNFCILRMLELFKNFFTHKDFLAPLNLPGKLFSPLHLIFSACLLAAVIVLAVIISKKEEKVRKRILLSLWGFFLIMEIVKFFYEAYLGTEVRFEWAGVLPFYPCSVYLYALPFCFSKHEKVRLAACGYLFTMGFIGASVNFVYPVNILSNYSCISFMGFHTLFFHGTMLFSMLTLIFSGYHTYRSISKWHYLILPALPMLIVSIPANAVNLAIGSDYMFFRCNSFFLPAIVGDMPDAISAVIVYAVYIIVPALFYLPGMIMNKKKAEL